MQFLLRHRMRNARCFRRFFATLVMLGNDFFICIPDRCLHIIARHYFHQVYRMLYISIQREELQDGIQDLRNAMSVTAMVMAFFPWILQGSFRQR